MKVSDTYQLYQSLSLYFKGKFDYIKYGATVRISEKSFLAKPQPERNFYSDLRYKNNPEAYLLGNFIFGNPKWVLDFTDEYELEMEKYTTNGLFFFKKDLAKLKPTLRENIYPTQNEPVPYLIELFEANEISMVTLCKFNFYFDTCKLWEKSDGYVLFSDISKKISKCTPFFNKNLPKYREAIINHFGG